MEERRKDDWTRVDALTDEDIAEAVANDPDALPVDIDWSYAVLIVPPKKKAISSTRMCSTFFKREAKAISAA